MVRTLTIIIEPLGRDLDRAPWITVLNFKDLHTEKEKVWKKKIKL